MIRKLPISFILILLFSNAFSQCPTPAGLYPNNSGVGEVTLYWPSQNLDAEYSIEYGLEGFIAGTGTILTGNVNSNDMQVEVSGLNTSTSYEFRLYETCINDETSSVIPATVITLSDCPSANYLAVNNAGKGMVRLDWSTYNQGGSYTIEYGLNGFESGTGQIVNGQINEDYIYLEIGGLLSSTVYEFRLVETCVNNAETTPISNTVTTLGDCPDIPYSLNISNSGIGEVEVNWETFNNGGTYTIEYGLEGFISGNGTTVTGDLNDEYMRVAVGNLSSSTTYEFRLIETCVNSETTSQTTATHTTFGDCPGVQYLNANNEGVGIVELNWRSFNIGGTYSVEYGPEGFISGSGTTINGTITDEYPAVEISNLDFSTAYTFRLTENCENETADEISTNITTLGECSEASNIYVDNSSVGGVEVEWDSYHQGQTYTIEYGPSGFTPGTGITVTGLISREYMTISINELSPSTNYDFRLTESCANGGTTEVINASITTVEECPVAEWDGVEYEGATEIGLEWGTYNLGQTYTIEYGPSGFARGTGSLSTGSIGSEDDVFVLIGGLTPETAYDFYLSETCSGGGIASLSEKVSGTTTASVPAPSNDACVNAVPLSLGTVQGTTIGATGSDRQTSCILTDPLARGVWYSYTANSNQDIKFDLCSGTNTFDSQIEIYTGSCADLTCLKSEDDDEGCDSNDPIVSASVTSGTTYYVYVSGYELAESGDFSLTVSVDNNYTPCVGPQNISIGQITEESAVVQWESVNGNSSDGFIIVGESGFNYYQEDGIWEEEGFTSSIRVSNVTGLTPNTTYEVYLAEICEELGEIMLAGPMDFTTSIATALSPEMNNGIYISNINGIKVFGVENLKADMLNVHSITGEPVDFKLEGNEIQLMAPVGNMYFIQLKLDDKIINSKVIK